MYKYGVKLYDAKKEFITGIKYINSFNDSTDRLVLYQAMFSNCLLRFTVFIVLPVFALTIVANMLGSI